MLFHSLEYAIFLAFVFLVYWALARTGLLRVLFLLVASYFFYACSNPWFLLLILASTGTNYVAGLAMGDGKEAAPADRRKLWLVVSLVVNLGLLGTFKYANFFVESFVDLGNIIGAGWVFQRLPFLLPAGISFYTFQSMSYTIDVYRGKLGVERDPFRFAFFVSFFPQLIAGPIVRAADFLPQVPRRPFFSSDQAGRAMWLIGVGLAKKVLVADYLATNLVDRVFDAPHLYSSLEVMLGLYAYTMQVYMDFSSYSDIAIGSALLLGYHLPDNFNRPYLATSVTDFWRRWHLTLGSWLRDYLYYPLGGSRGGDLRTYVNLFITFLLIGLWHGADWRFVVYGCLHACGMCINRYLRVNVRKREVPVLGFFGRAWRVLLTLNFVVLARILFRAQSFSQAGEVTGALLRGTTQFTAMTGGLWGILGGSYVAHWTPRRWTDALMERYERLPAVVQGVAFAVVLLLVMQLKSSVVPFIYFKF